MNTSPLVLKKTYAGRIRDPLYDLIEFEDSHLGQTLWKAIQSPAFQRLRRIKQLGFSDYVYPGATHTRFAHSLGVFHTAKQLLTIIKDILGKQENTNKADEALAAALLHDIGHGPFSHAFERVGEEFALNLDNHEQLSGRIIRTKLAEILDGFHKGFSDSIADMIVTKGSDIYGAVVSSQFDADRLDYMQRDRLMAGTKLAGIDLTWLLSNLEIGSISVPSDDSESHLVQTFVLNKKAYHAVESYVLGLFQLYPTVYFHKATRCLETMAAQMLIRIFTMVKNEEIHKTGLPSDHPYILFAQKPKDLDRILQLDDTVITGSLPMLMNAQDPEIKYYAKHLYNRIVYQCYDISTKFEKIVFAKLPPKSNEEEKQEGLKRYWKELEKEIKEESKKCGIDHWHVLLDSGERSPYKRLDPINESPLNQIYICDDKGQCIDISKKTDIIRSVKNFRFYRIYADRTDKKVLEFVQRYIKEKKL